MRRESAFLLATLLIALTAKLSPATVRYNLINLGVLEGYPQPEPVSINEHGRIVGVSLDVSVGVTARATLFDSAGDGNNIDLGTVGSRESVAASINNHNQIIGFAENSEDPPVWYLTVFDINGSGNNIPIFRDAFGRCINDNGIIAGHVYITVDQKRVESAALFNIN
jgi:hypothetical protein